MFSIVTDTSANLDTALLQQRQISVIPFHYYLDGQEQACHELNAFDGPSYYAAMRAGHKASTSQIPPQEYIDFFRPMLERDEDILLVSMSSGISGAYSSACMAAHQLREEFPRLFPKGLWKSYLHRLSRLFRQPDCFSLPPSHWKRY